MKPNTSLDIIVYYHKFFFNEKSQKIIIINFLKKESIASQLMQKSLAQYHRRFPNFYSYSIYFLKGTDPRTLNTSQQMQISEFVQAKPLSTSFLVYNSSEANRKLSSWYQKLSWIKPFYAIKSNPVNLLLKQLSSRGAGLDCASKTEIKLALDLGLSTNDIVYSNPIKDQNDLRWAEQNKISLTTADTIDQLIKIKQLAPNMKILWRISIKEDDNDHLATRFSGKFGDDIQSQAKIHSRMKQIQQMDIKLEGIHFHCGSGQHGSSGFKKAVLLARSCMQIGRKYGHRMQTLDIGGGFPCGDLNQKTLQALQITKNDPLGYKIIAEPGRHFSAYSFYLLTRVLGKRVKNGKTCFHLNESLYHSFNCNIMDGLSFEGNKNQFYSKLNLEKKIPQQIQTLKNSSLFGMTCDGMDVITQNLYVPEELKVSDWLCLSGMGAYTYGPKSSFNGMNSTEAVQYWSAQLQDFAETEKKAIKI